MKKIILTLSFIFLFLIITPASVSYSSGFEIDLSAPGAATDYYVDFVPVSEGRAKSLVIRAHFKDIPCNSSLDDDFINSLFGKKQVEADFFGFLPWGGLNDFLQKSSYKKFSLELGEVIDIELQKNYEDYTGVTAIEQDILDQIKQIIDISDYDINNDGYIDALYIFYSRGDSSDILNENDDLIFGASVNTYSPGQRYVRYVSHINNDYKVLNNKIKCLRTLVHETGHLIGSLKDYYKLPGFYDGIYDYNGADLGNIMSTGYSDFDAVAKHKMGWIREENIKNIDLYDKDSCEIELTPSDSDSAKGVKLAIIHTLVNDNDEYNYDNVYAVEYVAGTNNNNFDTEKKKSGFRIYSIGSDDVTRLFSKTDENGLKYQLLSQGDEITNLFARGLNVYGIETSNTPKLTVSFVQNEFSHYPIDGFYPDTEDTSYIYAFIDDIISEIPDDLSSYTENSVQKLKNAVNAVDRTLVKDDQLLILHYYDNIKSSLEQLELKSDKTDTVSFEEIDHINDNDNISEESKKSDVNNEDTADDSLPDNSESTEPYLSPQIMPQVNSDSKDSSKEKKDISTSASGSLDLSKNLTTKKTVAKNIDSGKTLSSKKEILVAPMTGIADNLPYYMLICSGTAIIILLFIYHKKKL